MPSDKLTRNAGTSEGAPGTGSMSIPGEPVGTPSPGYDGKPYKMGLYMYGGRLGEQGLRISDITWLTHEYLLVLHKRNPARCHLSRGRAAAFALETQNRACEDGAVPGLPAGPPAEQRFSLSAWVPAVKTSPALSPKVNL